MSDDKEVCEPPTLTSEQRNPFKTSESNKTDICPMTDLQSFIGKKDTLWHNFSKGPTNIEDCCPDGVSSSNLSKCLENKCKVVSNPSVCRSVVEGVDFNSTKTIDEQIKDKMKKAKISSQNKGEIYRAVIEQLMCNNAMFSLDKKNTYSKKCKKTNSGPFTPLPEDKNLQKCIDEYENEKTLDLDSADKLRACVDGLTDSTKDKTSSTSSYQKDINWTNGVNTAIALLVILIIVFMSLWNNKRTNGITLAIISIVIVVIVLGVSSINFWSSSFLENFNIIEHNDNKGAPVGLDAGQFWVFLVVALLILCIWIFAVVTGYGPMINSIYIFICSVIIIILLPKTLLSFSILNLVFYYATRTKPFFRNIITFIIKSGIFILFYSVGKLGFNMYMKKNLNLNKEQYGFLVTENILYIIIIGYLLSFIFSGKHIISLIKRLFTIRTQPTDILPKILAFGFGGVLSLVIAALSLLGGFTNILNVLTDWKLLSRYCMVDSENCDINCGIKKKLETFGNGFLPMFICLSVVAVILIVLVIQKLKSCNCLRGGPYYTIPFGLSVITLIISVAITLVMIFLPDDKDKKKEKESSSYSTIENLAIVIVIVLSIGINILSSIFGLESHTPISTKLFSLPNKNNSNTLTNFLTDYIYLLLPNLHHIDITRPSLEPTSTSLLVKLFGRWFGKLFGRSTTSDTSEDHSSRSGNKGLLKEISNTIGNTLHKIVKAKTPNIMSAKS